MSNLARRGVAVVFLANIINMAFGVITSFILPKYLSIESYGYYKVFTLYVSYLGFVHLGFIDGIYLKYGGLELSKINSNELQNESTTIRNAQLFLTAVALLGAVWWKNPIAIILSLSFVPVNMVSFYKNLFQATGHFKSYGIILSVLPMIVFIINMFLLLIIKTDNYIYYILTVFFSNLLLYIILEHRSVKLFNRIKAFTFNRYLFSENIKSGFSLMVGNFASLMITSIDRWCIQVWMTISAFAFYSFAVSVENLFNICVSAITITLYNYLCKERTVAKIIRLKSTCVIIGIYLIAIAFPVKAAISVWLQKYTASISSLFLLICAHLYYFVIKSIYVNLYKARGHQKYYLFQMLLVLAIVAISDIFVYFFISKTIEAFAWASLFSALVWFFICYVEFKDIRGEWNEILLMLLCSILYISCGLLIESATVGCFCYLIIATGLVLCLGRRQLIDTIDICIGRFSLRCFLTKKITNNKNNL